MFGMSMTEVLIILVVALLILGPNELPKAARTIGKTLRDVRRASDDLRDTFEREVMSDKPVPKPKAPEGQVPAGAPHLNAVPPPALVSAAVAAPELPETITDSAAPVAPASAPADAVAVSSAPAPEAPAAPLPAVVPVAAVAPAPVAAVPPSAAAAPVVPPAPEAAPPTIPDPAPAPVVAAAPSAVPPAATVSLPGFSIGPDPFAALEDGGAKGRS